MRCSCSTLQIHRRNEAGCVYQTAPGIFTNYEYIRRTLTTSCIVNTAWRHVKSHRNCYNNIVCHYGNFTKHVSLRALQIAQETDTPTHTDHATCVIISNSSQLCTVRGLESIVNCTDVLKRSIVPCRQVRATHLYSPDTLDLRVVKTGRVVAG